MINNIRFKIIAGKIAKFPNFTQFLPDYIIRQPDRGQAEAKCLRLRPRPRPNLWGRDRGQKCGHFGLDDLTSLPCDLWPVQFPQDTSDDSHRRRLSVTVRYIMSRSFDSLNI